VGPILAERLFAGRAVLLCSGTLRAGDDFEFIRERLSLPDAPELTVETPFDLESAMLLAAPRDIPMPDQEGYQELLAATVSDLGLALKGRTMVLYTSYRAMRDGYHRLRQPLGHAGIAVIAQGMDGSRHQLLEAFRDPDAPTVLLGTRSFWEGIDLPGPALSALVIARLPFQAPGDPVQEARAEEYDDPFNEYSLPMSILRLRQGAGRLIRSAGDRGVLVILDSRVHRRAYGSRLLAALPPCRRFEGPSRGIAIAAAKFLEGYIPG
jgi:DNA polymerase-3 subunit epsilon/ATP-dependent DNA helicase DinG